MTDLQHRLDGRHIKTSAATATEAQAVVEDSRARPACRRTRLGQATTTHTALDTTEGHHNGDLQVGV